MTDGITTLEGQDYMKNQRGELVPLEKVKPIDKLRDETVRGIVDSALSVSTALAEFKTSAFKRATDFCDLSFDSYGVKYGGQKGNITLTSFDGMFKVTIEVQDVISFDERLQAAKELVDKCVVKWSAGANANLRVLVNRAFQTDKKGKVDTKRILELRKYEINDPDWELAMDAISESITVATSREYMRIYKRNRQGDGYDLIPLDLASA